MESSPTKPLSGNHGELSSDRQLTAERLEEHDRQEVTLDQLLPPQAVFTGQRVRTDWSTAGMAFARDPSMRSGTCFTSCKDVLIGTVLPECPGTECTGRCRVRPREPEGMPGWQTVGKADLAQVEPCEVMDAVKEAIRSSAIVVQVQLDGISMLINDGPSIGHLEALDWSEALEGINLGRHTALGICLGDHIMQEDVTGGVKLAYRPASLCALALCAAKTVSARGRKWAESQLLERVRAEPGLLSRPAQLLGCIRTLLQSGSLQLRVTRRGVSLKRSERSKLYVRLMENLWPTADALFETLSTARVRTETILSLEGLQWTPGTGLLLAQVQPQAHRLLEPQQERMFLATPRRQMVLHIAVLLECGAFGRDTHALPPSPTASDLAYLFKFDGTKHIQRMNPPLLELSCESTPSTPSSDYGSVAEHFL